MVGGGGAQWGIQRDTHSHRVRQRHTSLASLFKECVYSGAVAADREFRDRIFQREHAFDVVLIKDRVSPAQLPPHHFPRHSAPKYNARGLWLNPPVDSPPRSHLPP